MTPLRSCSNGRMAFWCPGCNDAHSIPIGDGPGPRWQMSGTLEQPTFQPSILVTTGHYMARHAPGDGCACDWQERNPGVEPWPWPCRRCHSYVTEGQIQFLADCTHELAGFTVPIPPWPADDDGDD